MRRKSTRLDWYKNRRLVIDADGVDVDLSLPLRLDTTVGTRVFAGDTMIYGNTGYRNVTHLLMNGWTASHVWVLKYGEWVTVRVENLRNDNPTDLSFMTLPSGYVHKSSHNARWQLGDATTPTQWFRGQASLTGTLSFLTTPTSALYGEFSYYSTEWPTSLP